MSTTNGNAIKIPYFSLDPVDYYIKSRDTSDNWSDEPVVLTGESPATGVYSSVANKLYAADFTANGSLNDLVDTAGVLRTDTGVSNGTGVYTGDSLDIGEIGDYLVMVSAETLITPQDPTLDRMGVYLDSPYAKRRLLSELVADSMEGSENRQMYDLDGHNYALDSLYANFDNVKKPKEMDDLPCVTVEFRTSSDDATWSAWHDSPSRVVEGIRYVQPRVTMLTDYTELSVEMSKLTVEVTNIPGAGGDSYEKGFTDTTTKTFTHNLGGKPTIQVLDASGVQTEVCVTYVDDNTSKLDFIGTLTDHTFIATMGGAAASSQANSFTVNSTSVDYTLVTTDRVLIVDASSSNITVTLPAAASSPGFTYNIKKSDATSNTVIVDGNGSETIDGGTTAVITTQYETIQVVCDGTCWFIL